MIEPREGSASEGRSTTVARVHEFPDLLLSTRALFSRLSAGSTPAAGTAVPMRLPSGPLRVDWRERWSRGGSPRAVPPYQWGARHEPRSIARSRGVMPSRWSRTTGVRSSTSAFGRRGSVRRVSMLNLEPCFADGHDGAILEIPDVEDLHVVMFTAYYRHQELEVSIRRARMPSCRDSVRVSLEGLPEFFKWCSRANQIYFDGGKLRGFDAEDLAVLCGVNSGSIGVQLKDALDGLELAGIDVLDVDADADADVQGIQ